MSTATRRKLYNVQPGDQFVKLRNLTRADRGRVFEARDHRPGENFGLGRIGKLDDANHYLLDGTVAIRFEGDKLGIFGNPDDEILRKRRGYEPPAQPAEPEGDEQA